jgi:hypothetical protein
MISINNFYLSNAGVEKGPSCLARGLSAHGRDSPHVTAATRHGQGNRLVEKSVKSYVTCKGKVRNLKKLSTRDAGKVGNTAPT